MKDLKITKLSDEFGQYVIFLECSCGPYPPMQSPYVGGLLRLGCKPCRRCTPVAMFQMQSEEMHSADDAADNATGMQKPLTPIVNARKTLSSAALKKSRRILWIQLCW
jgi:hypothetical protein